MPERLRSLWWTVFVRGWGRSNAGVWLCAAAIVLCSPAQAIAAAKVVACVGDALTAGDGINNADQKYPAVLGKSLGGGYLVRNFGVSAATVSRSGESAYFTSTGLRDSDAAKPDLVVIMLGTNDGRSSTWPETQPFFESDFRALVDHYRALPSRPFVYIGTPCPVFKSADGGVSQSAVNEEIVPMVRNVARDVGAPLIDMYAVMAGKPTLFFSDGVRPNTEGAKLIAATVLKAIQLTPLPDAGADAAAAAPDASLPRDAAAAKDAASKTVDARTAIDARLGVDARTTVKDAAAPSSAPGAAGTTGTTAPKDARGPTASLDAGAAAKSKGGCAMAPTPPSPLGMVLAALWALRARRRRRRALAQRSDSDRVRTPVCGSASSRSRR